MDDTPLIVQSFLIIWSVVASIALLVPTIWVSPPLADIREATKGGSRPRTCDFSTGCVYVAVVRTILLLACAFMALTFVVPLFRTTDADVTTAELFALLAAICTLTVSVFGARAWGVASWMILNATISRGVYSWTQTGLEAATARAGAAWVAALVTGVIFLRGMPRATWFEHALPPILFLALAGGMFARSWSYWIVDSTRAPGTEAGAALAGLVVFAVYEQHILTWILRKVRAPGVVAVAPEPQPLAQAAPDGAEPEADA